MSDLRAIAEAAAADHGEWWDGDDLDDLGTEDAAHIAAWSPDRALAALDVIEAVRWFMRGPASYMDFPADLEPFRDALERWEAL